MGPIGLGDAVRVLARVEEAAVARALRMLGLEIAADEPPPAQSVPAAAGATPPIEKPPMPPTPSKPLDAEPLAPPAGYDNDAFVERLSSRASFPAWFERATALLPETGGETAPPIESLLTPGWVRTIVAAAFGVRVPAAELDVDAAVESLARFAPLEQLPRRMRRSLRGGAHIVLDVGVSMQTFFEDQGQFVAAAELLLAPERLSVALLDGPPRSSSSDDVQFSVPAGVPVVIVSNFGIVTRRDATFARHVGAWTAFATALRRHGHRPIALAPLDPAIVPPALRRALPIVAWDRRSGSGSFVRARSKAGGA